MKSNVMTIMAAFVCGQFLQVTLAIVGANVGFEDCVVFAGLSGAVITLSMAVGAYIAGGSGNAKHTAKQQQRSKVVK